MEFPGSTHDHDDFSWGRFKKGLPRLTKQIYLTMLGNYKKMSVLVVKSFSSVLIVDYYKQSGDFAVV